MAGQIEFEIGAHAYKGGGMTPLVQFHITRRLAPFMGAMAKVRGTNQVRDTGNDEDGKQEPQPLMAEAIQPIMDAVASMRDEDAEYVLFSCLATVKRKQNDSWAALTTSNKQLMFQDVDMSTMLQIAVKVLISDLGPFFGGLFAQAQAAAPATGHE